MKTTLSCEASFEFQELKLWKRRFRARLPSSSKSWSIERISSMLQFQCTKCLNTCKTLQNTIAQHQQRREKATWNHHFHCARKMNRNRDHKATTPETVAQASQLFSATEAPFTRKNTMFRANPNGSNCILDSWKRRFRARLPSNSKSWSCENDAFVRGFLPVPRVEETTRRLFARERKRWCYSSRKYDDRKITDEIFQCNLKMRKTERKKSERETYSEREREKRSADM